MEVLDEKRTNILWGAGARGQQCAKWFQDMDIEIAAIIDSDRQRWGEKLYGVDICAPDLLEHQSCNLIITPDKYIEDIKDEIGRIAHGNIHVFELKSLCKKVIDNMEV